MVKFKIYIFIFMFKNPFIFSRVQCVQHMCWVWRSFDSVVSTNSTKLPDYIFSRHQHSVYDEEPYFDKISIFQKDIIALILIFSYGMKYLWYEMTTTCKSVTWRSNYIASPCLCLPLWKQEESQDKFLSYDCMVQWFDEVRFLFDAKKCIFSFGCRDFRVSNVKVCNYFFLK